MNSVDALLPQNKIPLPFALILFKCDIRIGILHHISIGAHEKIRLIVGEPRACKGEQGK